MPFTNSPWGRLTLVKGTLQGAVLNTLCCLSMPFQHCVRISCCDCFDFGLLVNSHALAAYGCMPHSAEILVITSRVFLRGHLVPMCTNCMIVNWQMCICRNPSPHRNATHPFHNYRLLSLTICTAIRFPWQLLPKGSHGCPRRGPAWCFTVTLC